MTQAQWVKEQKLDPNVGVVLTLLQEKELFKYKYTDKDFSVLKGFLRHCQNLSLEMGCCIEKYKAYQ